MATFPETIGQSEITVKDSGQVVLTRSGNPIASFLETKDMDFDRRQFMKYVDVLTAEVTGAEELEKVVVEIGYKNNLKDSVTWEGTFTLSELAEALFTRITARYIKVRIASDSVGVSWKLGALEVYGRTHGRRF